MATPHTSSNPNLNSPLTGQQVPSLDAGFSLLFAADQYAKNTNTDVWQFALEIEELRRVGLTNNEFRWLLVRGFVEHAQEITLPGDERRAFRPLSKSSLLANTCFVLTETGLRVAAKAALGESLLAGTPTVSQGCDDVGGSDTPASQGTGNGSSRDGKPEWDSETRVLRLNGIVVKRFKWKACNQECVLSAFDEERWPERIDDPLAPEPEQDSKRRLADTIKNLNGKQRHKLIRFHGDGTGEGVTWEVLEENVSDNGHVE